MEVKTMFGFFRRFSQGAGIAVRYITIGALMMVWTCVWFYAMHYYSTPFGSWPYFVCTGFFLSGLALTVIGLLVGRIGVEARKADDIVVGTQQGPINAVAGAAPVAPTAARTSDATRVVPTVPLG